LKFRWLKLKEICYIFMDHWLISYIVENDIIKWSLLILNVRNDFSDWKNCLRFKKIHFFEISMIKVKRNMLYIYGSLIDLLYIQKLYYPMKWTYFECMIRFLRLKNSFSLKKFIFLKFRWLKLKEICCIFMAHRLITYLFKNVVT
jgi:hypothetical protein